MLTTFNDPSHTAEADACALDQAIAALNAYSPDQLRAAVDRNTSSAFVKAARETTIPGLTPAVSSSSVCRPADENEASNFDNLMRIHSYMLHHGLMLHPYTEETNGTMAPAENFIASVDALRVRASLTPQKPEWNPPSVGDDFDLMLLLEVSAQDIQSKDKWGRVVAGVNAWYLRAVELQRQAELEGPTADLPRIQPTEADSAMSDGDRASALKAISWLYERAKPTFGSLPFVDLAIARLKATSESR